MTNLDNSVQILDLATPTYQNPRDMRLIVSIGDFWSWAYSDLFSNTVRPMFAEYLVGHALGVLDRPRVEWIAYDFLNGKKIELKSSGYLQSEPQKETFSKLGSI